MLYGYPRTIPQAEALDKILPALCQKIDVVLNVDVSDAELIKRVTGRRMCKCGTTYHVQFNPPKVAGKCDACGADLYCTRGRTIPRNMVKERLQAYHAQTQPLIDFYNKRGIVANINGTGDLKAIFGNIVKALDKI